MIMSFQEQVWEQALSIRITRVGPRWMVCHVLICMVPTGVEGLEMAVRQLRVASLRRLSPFWEIR